ncbi:dioxygenase [Luteimonas padinae]|uniref:4,5-DOPA dioxygenase extradiol n=1 Tax=Luteimonas padinae TaxID=1714359 RepID=A0ABV6SXW2_9GAMM|nr:4,5-DOPA dioxygenase extradiol [Luteimonas padinae]GHD64902.1 dioxygenase [Luteimonas padinae]
MATVPLMPAAFLGHGSPMNALERNRYTEAWRAFGTSVPRPRAILAISAHWYVNATAVTAMPWPRTIHDFYGFPKPLFEVDYPAPGLPALAEEVADLARPDHVGRDVDGWGLDHGTWSVLVHAFPDADIPVVQLSINAQKPPGWHVSMGARLAALRERGVLVLGSGNVVHNLRAMDWTQPDAAFDWNARFDAEARRVLAERPGDAAALASHRDYARSAPTPEHFLPLLYLAGLAAAAGKGADVLVEGPAYGSLSMTSYTLDAQCPRQDQPGAGAAAPSSVVSADASNL